MTWKVGKSGVHALATVNAELLWQC